LPGATLTLDGCTVSGSTAESGGGIYLYYSDANLTNTTISGNTATAGDGGGIGAHSDNPQTLDLLHCTIASNTAGRSGGGVWLGVEYEPDTSNTIVAGNVAVENGPDIAGAINSQDYNLIQDTSGATIEGVTAHNITGQDPALGPRHYNGGDTPTHALLAGSPAIDAIPVGSCPLAVDQRGVARPFGDGCDMGAYESDRLYFYIPLVLRHYP
jgi:hypothetical protein